jgi:hypothetical protein
MPRLTDDCWISVTVLNAGDGFLAQWAYAI